MKTIGLLGGMTCESSAEYYKLINKFTLERLGGIHSARSVMFSVDFDPVEKMMENGDWDGITTILTRAAQAVERAGAEFLVICTNTMHKLADAIQAEIDIPILNIVDATAQRIRAEGIDTIGLLGTRFTMTQAFYRDRLIEKHGLKVLIPSSEDIKTVHRVIMEELSIGVISEASKKVYWEIIDRLAAQGAAGVILGCTEIPLLVKQEEGDVPLFDTTTIHALAAVDMAL